MAHISYYTYVKQATLIDFWGPLGHRAAWHHQDGNGLDPAESAAGMKKRAIGRLGTTGGFYGEIFHQKIGYIGYIIIYNIYIYLSG